MLGGHALEALSTSVLDAEVVHRHVPNVAVLREGDDDGPLLDEVFAVHRQGHGVDFASSIVSVAIHQGVKLAKHDAQSTLALGKDVLQIEDGCLHISVLLFDLFHVDLTQLVQASLSDGLGLCF